VFHYYVDDLAKSCSSFIGSFIVLYADDILLLAPTVSQLQQKLLTNCESVLDQLDMIINSKKSCCLRIGQTVRGLTIHVLLCVHYPVSAFHGWTNCDTSVLLFCVLMRLNVRFTIRRNYFIAQLMQFSVK